MKKYIFILVAMFCAVSCTDQQFLDDMADKTTAIEANSEFQSLIKQARWGDGQAYLKLADCYRDGKGVKQDFVGMLTMVAQADEYGGISNMEDYLKTLPEGSDFKLIFDAVEKYEKKNVEEATSMIEQLIAKGSPDGYTVQGIIAMERGDTLEGVRLISQAATSGSTLAELLLCVPDLHGGKSPELEQMTALSEKIPMVNIFLAKTYAGYEDESLKNEPLAAHYYLKADENACLDKRGARWLLYYHRWVSPLPLSERDILRLQKLADEEPVEVQEATPCNDKALEAAVRQVLQETMTERGCTTGIVYVVETQTGYIKANVSLERKGNSFVPYEDTYEGDQSTLLAGPTYIALLSTGRYTPDTMIDTESGIYKDVRDHNWRRGGYGMLTLEQALGYRSQVAFAKASESAFGNNQSALEERISDYLGGYTNHAKGVLTFYNAVANKGRMVMLQETADDVVVMNEQIEEPQHVKALQQGLTRAVSQGIFKRAGRKYTDVAACGRTFQKEKKTRRMELCGYFPADTPMYTIMVVLEKNGLPASAGMMCGHIMGRTIDILVDSYDLRSIVARSSNADSVVDSDVVVADTVVVQ